MVSGKCCRLCLELQVHTWRYANFTNSSFFIQEAEKHAHQPHSLWWETDTWTCAFKCRVASIFTYRRREMMWGWCSTPSAGRWSVCRNCTRRSLTHSWSEHTGRWMLNWWRHGGAHWTFPAMPWGLSLKQTKDIFRWLSHALYVYTSFRFSLLL